MTIFHLSYKNTRILKTNHLNFSYKKIILKFALTTKIMSKEKKYSLEKIGYIKKLPKNADINNYESLITTSKNGQKTTLYRLISENKEIDETINFNNSLRVFNSYLN